MKQRLRESRLHFFLGKLNIPYEFSFITKQSGSRLKARSGFWLVFTIACIFQLCLDSNTNICQAQPWLYDFGTGTGTFNSSTASTSFLPPPTSGTASVRVGTNPGSIVLDNPGLVSLGSGSEL